MANGDFSTWSTTAADNDDADPDINWREGQLPGTVNLSARTMMSALAAAVRKRPASNITLYVRTDGSDSNTGLANTAGGAFLTIQKAINVATKDYDQGNAAVTIQIADGTYTVGGSITGPSAPGRSVCVSIIGNTGTPGNVIINVGGGANCFFARDMAVVAISGMRLQSSGSSSFGIACSQYSVIDVESVEFGTFSSGFHMSVSNNASISATGNYAITGDAAVHADIGSGGELVLGNTITIGSARTFTVFITGGTGGRVLGGTTTFTGAGVAGTTGQRFSFANTELSIGSTTFPGSTAGVQYKTSGAGSTAISAWAFDGDLDSGIRRKGADNPAMMAGGSDIQEWTTSGTAITGLVDLSAASSGQIKFPASQNASANANTLDDYEEGTFTPAITASTPGNLSIAYDFQVGSYTKIGNTVRATTNIVTSSFTHTTASGTMTVTGLPFTTEGTSNNLPVGGANWSGITLACNQINSRASSGVTTFTLLASTSGGANTVVAITDMPSGGTVIIRTTLVYQASA